MISKELKKNILDIILENCISTETKLYMATSLKMSSKKECSKAVAKKDIGKLDCMMEVNLEDSASDINEERAVYGSINRVVDEDINELEGLSSVANGPCKSLDEILDIVTHDLKENKELTFQEYLFKLIDEKNLKDSTVYKRAGLSRQLFSIIRSDRDYIPKKKSVFALILALELDMDKSLDLLNKAGFAFTNNPTDIVVRELINNKKYSLKDANDFLYELENRGFKVEYLGY